jgi:hypothetical protein
MQDTGFAIPFESEISINVRPDVMTADEGIRSFDPVRKQAELNYNYNNP